MMGLWTREDLLNKCLDVRKAKPLPGYPPRTALTPQKVKAVLSKYNNRLPFITADVVKNIWQNYNLSHFRAKF